jgi:hypothetical protein
MPLFALIDRPVAAAHVYATAMDYPQTLPFRNCFETDIARSTLTDIRVGNTIYPLRHPREANFIPWIGEFLVDGFSPVFVGRGATPVEAQRDWATAVHAAFQELQHKRPFEMTPDDTEVWSVLSSAIDVTVYRNQTPVQIRQFGRIERARPYPDLIVWENGSADVVSFDQVESADFITFKPGQPFEAVVARDPVTFDLIRILYIQRRSTATRLPSCEEAALLDAIGSAKKLPAANWE